MYRIQTLAINAAGGAQVRAIIDLLDAKPEIGRSLGTKVVI